MGWEAFWKLPAPNVDHEIAVPSRGSSVMGQITSEDRARALVRLEAFRPFQA